MTFWKWSKTAASNGTADSTCPWPEGMAPSQINDSARGNMAALAKWRDDISGPLLTTGTSTAYALTSNQEFDSFSHMDGAMVCFQPHAVNGAAATLNIDGLGAKPIGLGGFAVLDSVLLPLTRYVATYDNATGVFWLHGFYSVPFTVPLGCVVPYIGSSSPNSAFVFPFGQALNRATYSSLFALIGTTFGSGDGSTTFNIPDLRGRGFVCQDNMGGTPAGRVTSAGSGINGASLGASGGGQNASLVLANLPPITPSGTISNGAITIPPPPGSGATAIINTGVGGPGGVGGGSNGVVPLSNYYPYFATQAASTFTGAAGGGSSSPVAIMQPSMVLPVLLRVV